MDPQDRDVYSSPVAAQDDCDTPSKSHRKPSNHASTDVALWSSAKRQSFSLMNTNPNAYFYRHVAPDQVKRTGAWNSEEKRLFLEAIKVHPPSSGKWGLFATHIPGRVGYQCRNFYHRMLESGELKALPGEIEATKRPRSSKRSKKEEVTVEAIEEEPPVVMSDHEEPSEEPVVVEEPPEIGIESLTFFSTKLKENTLEEEEAPPAPPKRRRPKPWSAKVRQEVVKFPAPVFEYEASAILRLNADNPLNLLLFTPPGGKEVSDEYTNAIRSHLVKDTSAQKDGLVAAYFRVKDAPE
jgi:hypothetical protein